MKKSWVRKIAAVLIMIMVIGCFTGFGTKPGIGNIVFDPTTDISPNVTYQHQVSIHSSKGVQRAYEIEANLSNGKIKPYVYMGSVSSCYKLSTMVSKIRAEGYQVIAGVNGDFYNTGTSVPLGLTMHNGIIYTSGSNESEAIGFKADGTAFLGKYKFSIPLTVNHTKTVQVPIGEVGTETGDRPLEDSDHPEGNMATEIQYETKTEQETLNYNVSYLNETMGSGANIHVYNKTFGPSTKTTVNSVEIVVNTDGPADFKLGKTITGTISQVKSGTKSTPIGDNQLVIAVADSSHNAASLGSLVVGDTISMTINNSSDYPWEEASEAMGAHDVLARNGAVTTTAATGSPRTCIGIQKDGTVILYAVDGRQSGFSTGLSYTEMAQYLVGRGCDSVINLDGGGSTTFAVRMPGETTATVVNRPSDGAERSIANGFFLIATENGDGVASNLTVYPRQKYMMPGASVQLSTQLTDNMFMPVASDGSSPVYSLSNENGRVSPTGIFTAGNSAKNVQITAEIKGITGTALMRIVDNVSFTVNKTSLSVNPSESVDINVTAVNYMYNPVTYEDSAFTWSCDKEVGTIDGKGVFTAIDKLSARGNIYVSAGNNTVTIPVLVGSATLFTDVENHWAEAYINELASDQVISGMGDGTFAPNAPVTRAQFVKLLAGTLEGVDVSTAASAGFTDIPAGQWYTNYVNWAAEAGIVSGMGDGTFGPNQTITREQMAVMLHNLGTYSLVTFEPTVDSIFFYDNAMFADWSKDAIATIVEAGIMNGKPYTVNDQKVTNFDPKGNATRGESAKVIYLVRDIINKSSGR